MKGILPQRPSGETSLLRVVFAGCGFFLHFDVFFELEIVELGTGVVEVGLDLDDFELDVVLLAHFKRPLPHEEVVRPVRDQVDHDLEGAHVDYRELELVAINHRIDEQELSPKLVLVDFYEVLMHQHRQVPHTVHQHAFHYKKGENQGLETVDEGEVLEALEVVEAN